MDKTIMFWENKGKLVPTRELIKTPEQIEGIRKAGVVNTGVLDEVAKQIHCARRGGQTDPCGHEHAGDRPDLPQIL